MADYDFPFPSRELADQELTYDPCYEKIPEEDRTHIVDGAWERGGKAARMVFEEKHGGMDFFEIARSSGLAVVRADKDYVVGGQRYFSDYVSGKSRITLYTRSITLWAGDNGLGQQEAENLILSHEFYHFLEWTRIGLASREYQVPMIVLGPIKLGKTGIKALSEIGAHAFARAYYELGKERENYVQT